MLRVNRVRSMRVALRKYLPLIIVLPRGLGSKSLKFLGSRSPKPLGLGLGFRALNHVRQPSQCPLSK